MLYEVITPVEPNARISAIKKYEKRAYQENQSQIFIETPYRNNHLFHSFVNTCLADTLLCVAINLMSESQLIKSKTIKQWKLQNIEIEKVPAVFIIMKPCVITSYSIHYTKLYEKA